MAADADAVMRPATCCGADAAATPPLPSVFTFNAGVSIAGTAVTAASVAATRSAACADADGAAYAAKDAVAGAAAAAVPVRTFNFPYWRVRLL